MSVVVPIIDLSPFLAENATREDKLKVAAEINKAALEVGFLTIVGHQIPSEVIDNAWKSTKEFFDLPLDVKTPYTRPQEEYPFGYNAMGTEVLSTGKAAEGGADVDEAIFAPPDIKEMFSLGPKDPKAGFPERIFPAKPQDFQKHWEVYYDSVNNLAGHILTGFAMAMELPDDFFEQYVDHHASALRAINYPAIASRDAVLPGQCRASAHTDYGTITILRTDGPGLQVSKDLDPPVWHDVPHIENGFIINLGDLMRRWTNDRWLSTLHRVIVPAADVAPSENTNERLVCRRRQSMAFFHNINRDAVVSTLLRDPDEVSKHEPIIAGEFLLQKHLASVGIKARK
jgi:isopenicillin N synthase-like dioxygenase